MYRERFDTGYLLFDISFFPLMNKCNMKNSGLFDDDVTCV